MIEAVIWDFGGVLTTSPFEAFTRFEKPVSASVSAGDLTGVWTGFFTAGFSAAGFGGSGVA